MPRRFSFSPHGVAGGEAHGRSAAIKHNLQLLSAPDLAAYSPTMRMSHDDEAAGHHHIQHDLMTEQTVRSPPVTTTRTQSLTIAPSSAQEFRMNFNPRGSSSSSSIGVGACLHGAPASSAGRGSASENHADCQSLAEQLPVRLGTISTIKPYSCNIARCAAARFIPSRLKRATSRPSSSPSSPPRCPQQQSDVLRVSAGPLQSFPPDRH